MSGPQLLFPDARNRSATAVEGKADMRAENIFSSIVVAHGGTGQRKAFTVPQGQTIPTLAGPGIAPTEAHQLVHSELTTNFTKAGEAGSALGDFTVKAIGINFEQAAYDATTGIQRAFGMGQLETLDTLSKTWVQFKVAGKKQVEGATFMFPASGGAFGSISTTEATLTTSVLSNGWPGQLRKLGLPILVARTDTVEMVFGVASSASLAFSTTASPGTGNASLVWFNLHSLVKGDVR